MTVSLCNMKKVLFVIGVFLSCSVSVWAQPKAPLQFKWWLEFTDKAGTPYSIDRPEVFLSARSLERRAKNGCPVTFEDLPVSPEYLRILREKGHKIHGASRWLNGAVIIADTATALTAQALPFVKNMTCVGRDIRILNPPNRPPKKRVPASPPPTVRERFGPMGYGFINADPLSMPFLYDMNERGKGIWVAVMDGGFANTDTISLFDSLALQGRLWTGPDVVERDKGVYESAQHGTSVLSVMGANTPGYFVGTAPDATYFLLKTEDTGGEFPIEEINWIFGAEWADSLGVDIINASLGYTTFSNPVYNRPYSMLDGRSTIGARGATIAAQKGMIICNSAGNSGDEPWHFLGVPADAPGVIAVGAIDAQTGEHAPFSSYGPSADGRIKPDLSAPGMKVVTSGNVGYQLTVSAGTSIASPILAGSFAALWSAFPDRSAADILNAVFASAHQRSAPDNKLGYGIPDFTIAWLRLKGLSNPVNEEYWYGVDKKRQVLQLLLTDTWVKRTSTAYLYNHLGQYCATLPLTVRGHSAVKLVEMQLPDNLPAGFYKVLIGQKWCRIGIVNN